MSRIFAPMVIICLLCMATNMAAQSIEVDKGSPSLTPIEQDLLPQPKLPETVASNLDFVGRLMFGPAGHDAVAQNPNNGYIYIGLENTLAVFRVSNPADPTLLGWLDMPDEVTGIHYPGTGDYAYVSVYNEGVAIVDISSPTSPSQTGIWDNVQISWGTWYDGGVLFVADGTNGLTALDVSNPASPVELNNLTLGSVAWDVRLDSTNQYAYVANHANGIKVIDVSNPAAMSLVTTLPKSGSSVSDVHVDGAYLYASLTGTGGVCVLNLVAPASPVEVTTASLPGSAFALDGGNRKIYVAGGTSGVYVLDNTTAALTNLVATAPTNGIAYGIEYGSDNIFVAAGRAGVEILDPGVPEAPIIIGQSFTPSNAYGVKVDGDYAYISDVNFILDVVDISDPNQPQLVASVGGLSNAFGLDVGNGHAYVANANHGMYTYDVSTPSNPVEVSTFSPGGSLQDLVVVGTTVYAAALTNGLHIIDVSDPANPATLGTYNTSGSARDVQVSGSIAVVADDSNGIDLIDVSNPANPTLITEVHFLGIVQTIWYAPPYIYTVERGSGVLNVIDATTPASAALVGSIDLGNSAYDIEVDGTLAFVSARDKFFVVDVSTPATPTLVSSTNMLNGDGEGIDWRNGLAYVADGVQGLRIVRTLPGLAGSYPAPGNITAVAVQDNLAFCGDTDNVYVVDISQKARPQVLGEVAPGVGTITALEVAGNYLYVGGNVGTSVIDISDPSNPVEVDGDTGAGVGIHVVGNRTYIAKVGGGAKIFDSTDPNNMVLLGIMDSGQSISDVFVEGNYAYTAASVSGLVIFEISDPANPVLVGSLATPNLADSVEVSNGIAYLGDSSSVQIINVSNPTSPYWVGEYFGSSNFNELALNGNRLYTSNFANGLTILDVTDPMNVSELGRLDPLENAEDVKYVGGYGYLAAGEDGAYIIQYPGSCTEAMEPNDSLATGALITDGVTYYPLICEDTDIDYFALTLAQAGDLQVTMQPPPGKDYSLFLENASGTVVAGSISSGDSTEMVTIHLDPGTWNIRVEGHVGQFDDTNPYTLYALFTADGTGPCDVPDELLYLPIVTLDANLKPVLHIQDPNQPAAITGYNIYRSDSPTGPWVLLGGDVVDMDEGSANIQYVDLTGDLGGPWFYQGAAYNNACSTEGPW